MEKYAFFIMIRETGETLIHIGDGNYLFERDIIDNYNKTINSVRIDDWCEDCYCKYNLEDYDIQPKNN